MSLPTETPNFCEQAFLAAIVSVAGKQNAEEMTSNWMGRDVVGWGRSAPLGPRSSRRPCSLREGRPNEGRARHSGCSSRLLGVDS